MSTAFGRIFEQAASRRDPRLAWFEQARPDQLLPEGEWHVCYYQGGRGSGKTRAGAQGMAEWLLEDTDGEGEYGIIAPTYADAWTKCVEGESGLLRALGTSISEIKDHHSATVKSAWRTYGTVNLHNGTVVYVDSANDGGLRIQGRNLKAAWADEIGLWQKWEIAWEESLRFAVRRGRSQIICTGTPKVSRPAAALIRRILRGKEPGGAVVRRLRTIDNIGNLSEAFYRTVVGASAGTRLERQELEGELLDDVPNALWTREVLEAIQIPAIGQPGAPRWLRNYKIGVDPSDGSEASDEQAYTIAGQGMPEDEAGVYITCSWGGQESPVAFSRRVILKAAEYDAELIIEKNHGGAWLGATFDQVCKELIRERRIQRRPRIRLIHASQAKRTRAEPVSALYERGIVRHAGGPFVELEDQMATFTGAQGERSPDRLDSLVWAATPFLDLSFGPPVPGGVRRWAASHDLELIGAGENGRVTRKLRQAHGGALAQGTRWDLDDFAPKDDDGEDPRGRRPNVREWV